MIKGIMSIFKKKKSIYIGIVILLFFIANRIIVQEKIKIEGDILFEKNVEINSVEEAYKIIDDQLCPKEGTVITKEEKYFDCVKDLKEADVRCNIEVYTRGYYEAGDGGESHYKIVEDTSNALDDATTIALDNGLYAELVVEDDKVWVEQFGAYGDGVHDDLTAIQNAMNSSIGTIRFKEKEYRCNSSIIISSDNKVIEGNGATIFSDIDYSDSKEWFIVIKNANEISLKDLKILTKSTAEQTYKTQMGIINSSHIEINNCQYIVTEKVRESIFFDYNQIHYNNLDLYSNWHDVQVSNCKFELLHDSEGGGCIWIRDMKKLGSSGLVFSNNVCTKISHDEILAIYIGEIRDVLICNNEFNMREGEASSSVQCFTVGSKTSSNTGNISFVNNRINAISKSGLFFLGNIKDVMFLNNNISYEKSNAPGNCFIFYNLEETISENVMVDSNEIQIKCDKGNDIRGIFSCKNMNVYNNTINCYAEISESVFRKVIADNNIINLYEKVSVFANNITKFTDNQVEFFGESSIIFQYNELLQPSVISRNTITMNYINEEKKPVKLLVINNAFLNNNIIEFEENNVWYKGMSAENRLYHFVSKDLTEQQLIFRNNSIIGMDGTYEKSVVKPKIIWEDS